MVLGAPPMVCASEDETGPKSSAVSTTSGRERRDDFIRRKTGRKDEKNGENQSNK
jgi:hypothetical protein